MGANATTFVPSYTSGEVLTAANLSVTNSGIPVFATTTTRDAAFGGTGEKVLAEGQYAYIEATNTTQYYDGAAWQAVGVSGLTLITAQTIGSAVSSVTVSNAFSATYDAYKITVTGGVGSAADQEFSFQLGASTTGYYSQTVFTSYNLSVSGGGTSNGAAFYYIGGISPNGLSMNMEIQNPFLAKYTTCQFGYTLLARAGAGNGNHQVATSYTSFTIAPGTGTLTGGTIRVYGYQNS